MRIDVVTLFPELFGAFVGTSMVGRAVQGGQLTVRLRSPREHGLGRHRSVDDTPYGGGPGMVLRVDCVVACLEALDEDAPPHPDSGAAGRGHRVLLTPQGTVLGQQRLADWARRSALTLLCGHYEGVDERIRAFVDEEVSLGDYVLSGGEVAAMAVIDGCARLLPGVLGNADSLHEESHSPATGGLLEYPQYTRPAEFRGVPVPSILQSGHHQAIADWRRQQALVRTAERRPDLLGPAGARRDDGSPGGEDGDG